MLLFFQLIFQHLKIVPFGCSVDPQLASACLGDTVSSLPFIVSCSGPSAFLCGWLHLVIFSIPCTFAFFARRSPPHSGLECFPSSLSDSGTLGDCFPGSELHEAQTGGSAYHTCCRIKGHPWKPGIMGGGKNYIFYPYPFVFDHLSDPPLPALPRHCSLLHL